MALRDKLRDRAQPYLEPGEQIQAVVLAQTGPSPWFSLLSWLIVLFGGKFFVVAITDRAVVALRAGVLVPSKPKELAGRFPRHYQMGEVKGIWAKTQLLGETTYVHKRFHKDLREADQALAASGSAPAAPSATPAAPAEGSAAVQPEGWYPDPSGTGQRYWDGSAWTDQTQA